MINKSELPAQKWDSLYIYCFSGTGNARISLEWIPDKIHFPDNTSFLEKVQIFEKQI